MKHLTHLFITFALLLTAVSSFSQTSYTWNGVTSTDFATSTNWTPNGVPGSGDNITIVTTSNDPVLDGNRTVNNLTMTSGTLDLATYTITVGNYSTLNGGVVHDGKLLMTTGTAKFAGTEMDCKVDVTGNITQVYDTHFKDSVALDETEAGGYYTRGSIFDDYTEITNSSTGYIRTSNSQPDTFRLKAVFNLEAAGYFTFCHNATTTYFEDDVVLNNHSGNTGKGFLIGGHSSATVHVEGDIEMNVTTGSGYIKFNVGNITHNGTLSIGSEGYHSGLLTLKTYEQGSATIVDLTDLSDNATIALGPNLTLEGDLDCPALATTLNTGCHFKGDVTIPDLRTWNGATFDGVTNLTITTGTVTTSGNIFKDTTTITNSGTGYLYTGNIPADTFLAPVTFNLEAAGFIHLGKNNADNYYEDNVTLNNHSGASNRGFQIGSHASATNTFDGEIELNSDTASGFFKFWIGTTHNGLLTVGSEGLHGDYLTLREYVQTEGGTIDLSGASSTVDLSVLVDSDIAADIVYNGGGTVTLTDAVFQGNATIDGAGMAVTGCAFHGTTYLKKTGSTNNLNGDNKFHGVTTIENASASNYLYFGNSVPDTFLTDLTLINRSSQPIWLAYNTETPIGGDLTLDGDSASVIRIGSSSSGRIAVFNGSTDQHLSIEEEDLTVTAYRLEVDNSAGRVKLNNDITLTHELKLTDGIIESVNEAVLTLNDGVAPTATDTSYVEGKVKKIGNDAFDFPVGRNGVYRPISISAPSSVSDAFTAEYFESNSDWINSHSSKDGSLDYLSTNEYWTLTRDAGTSTPVVTLSWDTLTSCVMDTNLATYHVAGWDGSNWDDLGNGGTTGDSKIGTISTASGVSDFEMFVLESDSAMGCLECNQLALINIESDSCFNMLPSSEGDNWVVFEAISENVRFDLSFDPVGLGGDIDTISLFEGFCSDLLEVEAFFLETDTSIVMEVYNLAVGTEYYVHSSSKNGISTPESVSVCLSEISDVQTTTLGSFGLLCEDGITTSTDSCWVVGKVGSGSSCSAYVTSSDSLLLDNSGSVSTALAEAEELIEQLENRPNRRLAAFLDRQLLSEGVYLFDGDLEVDTVLRLKGDTTSTFVFVVNGNLTAKSQSQMVVWGLNPKNIFWIVTDSTKEVTVEENARFYGNILSKGSIEVSNQINGVFSALSVNKGINISDSLRFAEKEFRVFSIDKFQSMLPQPFDCVVQSASSALSQDCGRNEIPYTEYYQYQKNFIPDDCTPIKTVMLNFHIWQDDNGEGNLPDDQETLDYIAHTVQICNSNLSSVPVPSDPVDGWAPYVNTDRDTKIRYDHRVFFHQDDNTHSTCNVGTLNSYIDNNFSDDILENAIQIHFTNNGCYPPIAPGMTNPFNFNRNQYVRTFKYGNQWAQAANLIHEVGHNFNLLHTYDGSQDGIYAGADPCCADFCNASQPNFLFDVLDVNSTNWCGTSCSVCYHNNGWGMDAWANDPSLPDYNTSTNNILGGSSGSVYTSPLQAGRMHQALSLWSTRNVVVGCPYCETPLEITEDEIWDFSFQVYNDIVVKTGNTLTITCEVLFPNDAKLIVEPGARLVVDGGVLTASCEMWQGIQVHGVDDENQSTSAGGHHGVVELKGGAIIEHAKIGIDLIDQLSASEAGGGVVIADEATIQNCAKGVAFGPYTHQNNISSFTDVTFFCDQPLNGDEYNGRGTGQFVTIWDTYGIQFKGCTFEFDHDNPNFPQELDVAEWPTGIFSAYGGYDLYTSGSGYTGANEFKNLQIGVMGYDLFGSHQVRANYNKFTNVYRNFDFAGTYRLNIRNCEHELPQEDLHVPSYGFRSDHNVSFKVFDNIYEAYPYESFAEGARGALVHGSLEDAFITFNSGEVFDNDFDDLYVATQTERNNLIVDVSCNKYGATDGNGYDWALNPQFDGLLADQGTACPPDPLSTDGIRSGNTFQNVTGPANLNEFNLQDITTYYAAGGNNANTIPSLSGSNIEVEGGLVACDMTATDPSCDGTVISPYPWDVKRYNSQQTWSGKMADLDSLETHIDSSQTQLLLDTIANLNTNDTVLKTVLLNHSPLSDTVLTAYVLRDTTKTELNFREVFLKNLPAAKPVWELALADIDKFKTQSVKDTLKGAQVSNPNATTATSLNREIRYHGLLTNRYADDVADYWLENDAADSAKAYMDTVGLYPLRVALLGMELSERNLDEADSSLVKLPLKTVNDTAVYDVYDILIDLRRDTLNIRQMNSTDSTRMCQIAFDTTLDASVLAQGVVSILLDTLFLKTPEEIPGSPSERRAGEDEPMVESPTKTQYFKAYPNPFTNTTTISYDLGKECELGCVLRLYDIQGRVILEEMLSLQDGKGQFEVDMSRYGSGLYYCTLYGNQQLLQTEKLILMR